MEKFLKDHSCFVINIGGINVMVGFNQGSLAKFGSSLAEETTWTKRIVEEETS